MDLNKPGPDFRYAAAPRNHLTHPHGARVHKMVDEMLSGIARASGERGMRFLCLSEHDRPGRMRDTSLVYRQQFNTGTIQVPLLQCVVDLTYRHPERKAVQHLSHLQQMPVLLNHLDQFTVAHYGSMYGGCGLLFNEVAKLFRTMLKVSGNYCVGQAHLWPINIPGDDRDRDMAVVNMVLRDELDAEANYDYQITLIWNGPDRFQRLLFRALDGQTPA